MSYFDVFNGDADGICALHQLRLARPLDSVLVTGVKRDIALLEQINATSADQVTVLDIALSKNSVALNRVLESGARVQWFDHHQPGRIPEHANLEIHIDTSAHTCTSLLVNQWLRGQHLLWAVAAAFGDNLHEAAHQAAAPLDLNSTELERLRELGEAINYNAYGDSVEDLHFPPDELYRRLHNYADPFDFMQESPEFARLRQGYVADMAEVAALKPELVEDWGAVYVLPATAWARRVCGVWANELAQAAPGRAHAVLICRDGGYRVSVRAPLSTPRGADELSAMFSTGGGRKGAAGINHLQECELPRFMSAFGEVFAKGVSV